MKGVVVLITTSEFETIMKNYKIISNKEKEKIHTRNKGCQSSVDHNIKDSEKVAFVLIIIKALGKFPSTIAKELKEFLNPKEKRSRLNDNTKLSKNT